MLGHRCISNDEYIVVNMDTNIIKKNCTRQDMYICVQMGLKQCQHIIKKKIHCQLKEKILEKNTELFIYKICSFKIVNN